MSWFPLHVHSHFSLSDRRDDSNSGRLLDALSQPAQIVERVIECGYEGCALTDHGSIAGCPSFLKAMAKAKKKAILGCEFFLSRQDATIHDASNVELSHLCVLAKNQKGWKSLIRATSTSFAPTYFLRKPRLDLDRLAAFSQGDWIVFSGHMGSDLANACFADPSLASQASYEEARELAKKHDWKGSVIAEIRRYQKLFGESNFFIEIHLLDRVALPASLVVAKILRNTGKELGVSCVATSDSHYLRRDDAADQRVLLCSAMDANFSNVTKKMEWQHIGHFFKSDNYHIPSLDEMRDIHTEDELENCVEIAKKCEEYSISSKPLLPAFACPNDAKPESYLTQLCREGFVKRINRRIEKSLREPYVKRIRHELPILIEAGLSSYFLIVADFVRFARSKKWLVGKGRGSASGCLTSYLLDITNVDPLQFDLIFERFYNAGRNSPGRVALPDIDCDFPIRRREEVFDYVRQKYGEDRVCQMSTFSRMQGRGALKEVLRVRGTFTYEEMNKITEHIPDEAEIADQLQEMQAASIIRWALENNPDPLREYCYVNEHGDLDGDLAPIFAQAIRIEGTKRNVGKHASGVLISGEPLGDIFPMVWDKSSKQMIVGVDMRDAEEMGGVKFDILGTTVLDKIMGATSIVRSGVI